ncbi:hypothetical protein HY68_14385 [Streptomyces sp. AcH 505]|nr:hypothetical protein HY68_14385 [Streptomyces sp. AcH 505]
MGLARHLLLDALDAWGLAELGDVAALVLSELMTNAVLHAHVPGRMVETWIIRQDDSVRIEVHDASDELPQRHKAADDDEGGRGLALVDELTNQRWGASERRGVGKLVWAQVGGEGT